jgi:O-antigen/teichoic acid export membrane protein
MERFLIGAVVLLAAAEITSKLLSLLPIPLYLTVLAEENVARYALFTILFTAAGRLVFRIWCDYAWPHLTYFYSKERLHQSEELDIWNL